VTESSDADEHPTLLLLHHLVANADRWRRAFDAHEPQRRRFGATGHHIWRFVRDPDNLMVGIEFPSVEAADRFLDESDLLEVMRQAGVFPPPSVFLMQSVEAQRYDT
jgi:hypothetical protein